ncbi:MAG: hypothetical protein IT165_36710 [Bryobacterales bacterium]|nr:hypothetical protein [Bryobacterales bacterium]
MFTKLLFTLATALVATTAYAQKATADIPFPFSVGKTVLPAGSYTFDTDVAPGVLRIRSHDWKNAVIVITNGVDPARNRDAAKVVFNQYGNTFFLSRVLYQGAGGRELMKSPREKEIAAATPEKREVLLAIK